MTWSELIQHGSKFAPNADVWLSVERQVVEGATYIENFRLDGIRKEGQLVFLDGAEVGE
jgi:hypothetical protein